jgi:hypothetical protein
LHRTVPKSIRLRSAVHLSLGAKLDLTGKRRDR